MFSESVPHNTDTPVLLVDWIKERLNDSQWWKEIKPNRAGPLRYHLSLALARNNFQQDAVPFMRTAISDLEKASEPKLLRQAKEELGMLLLSRSAGWSPDPQRDAEGIQLLTEIVASNDLEPSERFGNKLALAWGYLISGNPKQAEEIANELLNECDSLDPPQPLVEAEVILFAAGIWNSSGRAARSVDSLRALLQDHGNELDWQQSFLANFELANALGWMGLEHFPESLSILESLYSKTRTKFGNVRHPNVLKVASLYVTNAIKLGGQPKKIIALLDADFGTLSLEEPPNPGLARITASVLLAKCQIGQAEECWSDCLKILDQSIDGRLTITIRITSNCFWRRRWPCRLWEGGRAPCRKCL